MKNTIKIFRALILPIFSNLLILPITTAQKVMPERCELTYDSIGYCIDGQVVIPQIYQHASNFSGEAAAVRNRQYKYALIDEHGKEITPFIYDELAPSYYFPGRFACKLGSNVGIIDDKGKPFIPLKYQTIEFQYVFNIDGDAYYDSNTYFILAQDWKYGILNYRGTKLCDFKYDKIWIYSVWGENSMLTKAFVVAKNGKVQIMHSDGTIYKGFEYNAFLGFWGNDMVFRKGKSIEFFHYPSLNKIKTHPEESNGSYFIVEEDGKKGVIDSAGNICIPIAFHDVKCSFTSIESASTRVEVLYNNSWGLYTAGGKEIVPAKYDEAALVCMNNEKILKVRKGDKWALFEDTGKQISEFKYDELNCWTKTSVRIQIGERKGEMFFDGREVWE